MYINIHVSKQEKLAWTTDGLFKTVVPLRNKRIKLFVIGTSLSEPHHRRSMVKSVFLLVWVVV